MEFFSILFMQTLKFVREFISKQKTNEEWLEKEIAELKRRNEAQMQKEEEEKGEETRLHPVTLTWKLPTEWWHLGAAILLPVLESVI